MTEKEKCKSGILYNSNDKELFEERQKAKKLCSLYNKLCPDEIEEREKIIKELLLSIGKDFCIEQSFWCDYGYNIKIGDNFYSNHNLVMLDCAEIDIGDNVFVAPNCGFYTASHPLDFKIRNAALEYAKPIKIGSNVWIGAGVSILGGVTIGSGSVIGAGSVVNRDIGENCLAAGNPCKEIRKIENQQFF